MFRIFTTAAILAFAVTTAQAETPESMVVAYGDLNLSQPRDAQILADRLQVAATSVCANTTETTAPIRKVLMRRCVDMAVSRATSQIWDQIEAGPNRAIRANLVSVRQKVASADVPLN
ncbi:MAG TPA: UrcA family protein [Rhizomicrobium sp.]